MRQMDPSSVPLVRDLVLVGGGHAHALVLRMWGMNPLPGVRLTVINPGPVAPYTGMLPGHVAGHYSRDDLMIDLVRLARFAGARIVLDRAVGLDRAAGRVLLAGCNSVRYDVASLDVGVGSGLAGFEAGVAAKPLGDYAARWQAFVERALPAPRMVVVGAGVGGVELALASAWRLRQAGAQPRITLLDHGPAALPNLGRAARARLLAELDRAGIAVLPNAKPLHISATQVILQDGRLLPSDFTLMVAGATPQPWLSDAGLALTDGFVTVGPTLQSSDPAIFAAGDCAHLSHAPRPKAGVFAVREAPILHHNLRAALTGGAMRAYHPQRDYLKLISTGDRRAIADLFGLRAGGGWLWHLKDRIDRRFMAQFADYPAMPAPAVPSPATLGLAEAMAAKPLCGGCGAKVGGDALRDTLATLPAPQNPEVLSGPGDDAAILRHGSGVQVITTDHLRSLTQDPRLMAEIAAIHALGDIWAMGATPQAALAQITLPRLSPALQSDMLAEIMAQAAATFTAAGADIVGGHTSIGAELTIGFTVTGLALRPIRKAGAQPGDALILTKPIGTGTILAAEMAIARLPGLLLGEVIAACFASMTRPQGAAAAILAPHAHAMTDVTGFGLAGHLMELLDASGIAATLTTIPTLPGASDLARAGHASTLAPANRAALVGRISGPDMPLLYDPQTCGGLLAAVPAKAADALVEAICAAGDHAAIIGHITHGPAHILYR